MKKHYLLLLLLPLFFFSCKKKLTEFYVDYTSDCVISSTFSVATYFSIITPEMETNSEYNFENNNTKKKYIKSIYLKDLVLTIKSPNGQTFSFLNEVEVYLSAPGLSEISVAKKSNISNSIGNTLALDLENVDLQEYIKSDKFSLRLRTKTDETIAQDVDISIYTNFLVGARLIRFKK